MLRIEAERKKRNWTQVKLAYLSDLHVTDISKIENGWVKPFPRYAERLSLALGVPADELCKEVRVDG